MASHSKRCPCNAAQAPRRATEPSEPRGPSHDRADFTSDNPEETPPPSGLPIPGAHASARRSTRRLTRGGFSRGGCCALPIRGEGTLEEEDGAVGEREKARSLTPMTVMTSQHSLAKASAWRVANRGGWTEKGRALGSPGFRCVFALPKRCDGRVIESAHTPSGQGHPTGHIVTSTDSGCRTGCGDTARGSYVALPSETPTPHYQARPPTGSSKQDTEKNKR